MGEVVDGQRRRGRPPRIDRAQIVAVASTFDAEVLTMQAVADELGVDRKAINYHVSSREDLLQLVAADIFRSHIESVVVSAKGDWRDTVRTFAVGMRDAVVAAGSFAPYFKLPAGVFVGALEPVERVLETLVRAGFDELVAARALDFIVGAVLTIARREMSSSSHPGPPPEMVEFLEVLDALPKDALPVLRRVIATYPADYREHLLDFDLDVVIAGLEQLLAETPTTRDGGTGA
jgi:AcrR family transcriptional regulator